MDELIARLNAQVTAVVDTVGKLRRRLAAEQASGLRIEHGRKSTREQRLAKAEAIATALEQRPMGASELSRIVGTAYPSNIYACMRTRPDWFVQMNGKGSPYMLTEAGRNRHKTDQQPT